MEQPQPEPMPRPPETPWYERPSKPLSAEEVDEFDRAMAPERLKRRGSLFDRR